MPLSNCKIVLTGSSGGIGRRVTSLLLERGASLVTISRSADADAGTRHLSADLSSAGGLEAAASLVKDEEPDILINLAGVQHFGPFEQQSCSDVGSTYTINLIAPVILARAALSSMKRKKAGQIVNIGSILGSIGFAYFSTYSSSKAGLRLFSEALRRELNGTGVVVTYIAPRATRTGLITSKLQQYADLTRMAIDDPDRVASQIVHSIELGKKDVYLGAAERLFVKLNGVMPRLVDSFLTNNDRKARRLFLPELPSSEGTKS